MAIEKPRLTDIETILRVYNSSQDLNTSDLKKLYPGASAEFITLRKRKIKQRMKELGVPSNLVGEVNTNIAFEVLGIDVLELEKKWDNLVRLGFLEKKVKRSKPICLKEVGQA